MQPIKNCLFFLFPFLLLGIISTHQGHAAPIVTAGSLLKYLNQTEFETAFPGLPMEDFEESPVEPELSTNCIGPLDSTTDQPGCFAPGDIMPGLSIDTDLLDGTIPVLGAGFDTLTTTSKTLSSSGYKSLSISFTGSDVYAVGMDLAAYTAGGSTYSITVNGSTGTLDSIQLAGVSTSGTFLGIYAPSKITQIILTNTENEVVDNIRFGGTASTLSFFTLQSVFQNAHTGLAIEDFEESRVTAGNTSAVFAEPLDATTNNAYFSPGEITPGLQITTVSTADPSNSLWTLAARELLHNTSKIVGSLRAADNLQIVFQNNNTYAAGMDLLLEFAGNVATIIVYGPNGTLSGLTQQNQPIPAETFFGIYAQQPISRIEILSPASEFIDNIQFGIGGRFPWPLFLPAITGNRGLTAP